MNFLTAGGPGVGFFPQFESRTVRFTEAAVLGTIVMFDFNNVATGLTVTPGGNAGTSFFNTVRQPDATAAGARTLGAFWFGVALATQAPGSDGEVCVRGIVPCNVPAACVAGSTMVPQSGASADQLLITTGGTLSKIIAIGLEADVSNIATCIFDGISGFGADYAS